jgi:hypothetical protein
MIFSPGLTIQLKINQAKALLRWAKEKFKRVQNSKHVGMS